MSSPQFDTAMERVQIMASIRSPAIVLPEDMLKNREYEKNVSVSILKTFFFYFWSHLLYFLGNKMASEP